MTIDKPADAKKRIEQIVQMTLDKPADAKKRIEQIVQRCKNGLGGVYGCSVHAREDIPFLLNALLECETQAKKSAELITEITDRLKATRQRAEIAEKALDLACTDPQNELRYTYPPSLWLDQARKEIGGIMPPEDNPMDEEQLRSRRLAKLDIALLEVQVEMKRQDQKWGADRSHPPEIWALILGEETGEVQKAALESWAAGDQWGKSIGYPEHLQEYRKELIQVAAVAVQAVLSFDRNEGK